MSSAAVMIGTLRVNIRVARIYYTNDGAICCNYEMTERRGAANDSFRLL